MSLSRKTISDIPSLETLEKSLKDSIPEGSEASDYPLITSFLSKNSSYLEFQDRDLLSSTKSTLNHYCLFSLLAPTVIYLSLPVQFSSFSKFTKSFIIGSLYLIPTSLFVSYYLQTNKRLMIYEYLKYHEKVKIFLKTSDRSVLNPHYEDDDNY